MVPLTRHGTREMLIGSIVLLAAASVLGWWHWPLSLIIGPLLWLARRNSKVADKPRLGDTAFLPVTALLYAVLTGVTYIFSAFVPYEQHITSSIDRLLAEVVPLLVLWLVFLAYSGHGTAVRPAVISSSRT